MGSEDSASGMDQRLAPPAQHNAPLLLLHTLLTALLASHHLIVPRLSARSLLCGSADTAD